MKWFSLVWFIGWIIAGLYFMEQGGKAIELHQNDQHYVNMIWICIVGMLTTKLFLKGAE